MITLEPLPEQIPALNSDYRSLQTINTSGTFASKYSNASMAQIHVILSSAYVGWGGALDSGDEESN